MSLAGLDLNLLVALEALLAEANVTRAAERLSVGQPAMSASLARLRKHFDDPLLVKQGRHLVPTPLAESLAEPVHEAIIAVEAVMGSRAVFDPTTDQRAFTVVASDYVTLILLRPLFARLAVIAPGVRVTAVPLPLDFGDQLRRGQVDLLIMPTALMRQEKFPNIKLFNDRFVLACSADNPEVGDEVTPEQFSKLPYLSYLLGSMHALGERELEEAGIQRRVEVVAQSFVMTPFLLTGTRLVSLLQERLARRFQEYAGLRILEPPVPLRPAVVAMYWSPRHSEDPAHRWLRERIVEVAACEL
jgi:DNA-binding transcriptional LysR family regulator